VNNLFADKGVHCIVDGQFGSTGKGALAAWLAEMVYNKQGTFNFAGSIYSGGPNSGHTCYIDGEKTVLKQLPTTSVYMSQVHNLVLPVYLSAGAIIDRDILKEEAERYPDIPIFVHPNATIVTDEDRKAEETGSIAEVAGTRSGTGEALIRKIRREPKAIARESLGNVATNVVNLNHRPKPEVHAYFMEVSQGFSLGINSEFYPKVTSRECTVMQGLADARIPPRHLARTYLAIRSYPIRVGNIDGHSSGDWYYDQYEIDWKELGVEPEITTVTKRVRRVATFSTEQVSQACRANDPDFVFISHMDYVKNADHDSFIENITYLRNETGKEFGIIIGGGPAVKDIVMME
jgi:adenylosuccinate synthase